MQSLAYIERYLIDTILQNGRPGKVYMSTYVVKRVYNSSDNNQTTGTKVYVVRLLWE